MRRYLFDGEVPARSLILSLVSQAIAEAREPGFGMWRLARSNEPVAGCVRLEPRPEPATGELTWLLTPALWGQGLAFRMVWSAIEHGFRSASLDTIVAATDGANTASEALMRRLGMRYRRQVMHPLGPGPEYVLARGDAGPEVPPEPLPMD